MADQQAGWYPDPSGDAQRLRYWDGAKWTSDFSSSGTASGAQSYGMAQTHTMVEPVYYKYSEDGSGYAQPTVVVDNSKNQTLALVVFVFCVISLISCCWLIIPLAWMIPLTIMCWGVYKGTRPNTVALGVVTLIFISLVAGILLLIADKE
jgi:hypothetical protein